MAVPGLLRMVLTCAFIGVIVAALVLPFTVTAGAGVRSAAESVDDLPGELEDPQVPQRSELLAADGSPLATLFLYDREIVDLEQMAPVMQQAIVAIEDERFYSHLGVDIRGTLRAAVNNQAGGPTQGGSTLTQQYVKNALMLAAETEEEQLAARAPTLGRKMREARLAFAVERDLTKDEILQKYLNIAYFGDGAYGVQAAARHYFGVAASDLDLSQSAALAGVVRNPARDLIRDPDAAVERRDLVLGRMLETGVIDAATYEATVAAPLELQPVPSANGCAASSAPFFCDWVRRVLESDPAFGDTPEARRQRLLEGGLIIRTTLDPTAQAAAQDAVDTVPRTSRVAAAIVTVRPGTGEVTSMAANRTFGTDAEAGETELALATDLYQPGSTFKTFTLAAALESGVPLNSRLPGGNRHRSRVFDNPASGSFRNAGDGAGSNLTLTAATAKSVNTAFVQLQEKIGTFAVADTAARLGITTIPREGPNALGEREGSFTLGSREVSPLEMAGANAALAASGVACRPIGVRSITDSAGVEHPVPDAACHQAIDPAVADTVASVLSSVVTEGTGRRAAIGRPVAGKTGTTQNSGAAWFTGFTPDLAAAVWMGDPRGPRFPLRGVLGRSQMYGGDLPATIFSQAMRGALAATPPTPLPSPDGNIGALPVGARLPDVSGLPLDEAVARLREAGVNPVTAEVPRPAAMVPPRSVLRTSPPAGSALVPGGTVQVEVTSDDV